MSDQESALGSALEDQVRLAFEQLGRSIAGLGVDELNAAPAPETSSLAVLVHHSVETARSILHDVAGDPLPRDRESAFRVAGASEADLRRLLDAWQEEAGPLFAAALRTDLARPLTRYREASAGWWLLQALAHTREHAGHAELTRQLVQSDPGRPDA
ncbi:MAG TPA: DinB family protein [Candidatus Limnocylindrales bacterium]|nr:DinB family protein [Candidatus Limnocylindrales bacterium]